MNDELKAVRNLGAELGAAKAENDRLRGLLREAAKFIDTGDMRGLNMIEVHAALSQQSEPTDTYTAVDMATAAAQGFRDGQAAVEQAAAQDEAELSAEEILMLFERNGFHIEAGASYSAKGQIAQLLNAAGELLRRNDTRPAQTEQQPEQMNISPLLNAGAALSNIAFNLAQRHGVTLDQIACDTLSSARKSWDSARAALNFQQGKFRMGDLVKKSTGSEWEGRVVGWYSTEQTPEGYAVESSAHRNSVQIYPAKALEAVE